MMRPSISEVTSCELPPSKNEKDFSLEIGKGQLPPNFNIRRTFWISNIVAGEIAEACAYKSCSRVLISFCGTVYVSVFDGTDRSSFELHDHEKMLIIPPLIWSTCVHESPKTVLCVLCDEIYNGSERLDDYKEYLSIIGT